MLHRIKRESSTEQLVTTQETICKASPPPDPFKTQRKTRLKHNTKHTIQYSALKRQFALRAAPRRVAGRKLGRRRLLQRAGCKVLQTFFIFAAEDAAYATLHRLIELFLLNRHTNQFGKKRGKTLLGTCA